MADDLYHCVAQCKATKNLKNNCVRVGEVVKVVDFWITSSRLHKSRDLMLNLNAQK